MDRVILIDSSTLSFRSILNYMNTIKKNKENGTDKYVDQPHYSYFKSLLSRLKRIGISKNDLIIVACEGRSWRKDICSEYKGNRPDYTEWKPYFKKINWLHEQLDKSTNWHFVREWHSENDDIVAVCARYYKDKEVIIVSSDKDLKQLCYYDNVSFFNINLECKNGKGMYEKIDNPLKILSDLCINGDEGDNVLVYPNETEEDVALRKTLVDLINLPEFVITPIIDILKNLPQKEENLELIPFKDGRRMFEQIYDTKYKLDKEYCYQLLEKRDTKKKDIQKEKNFQKKLQKYREEFKNRPFESLTKKEINKLIRVDCLSMLYPDKENFANLLKKE